MAGFCAAAKVLLLVTPVYLLQISDRVPPSANYPTLTALTGVAIFLPDCFRLLDWMRQRMIRTPPERQGQCGTPAFLQGVVGVTHASPLRSSVKEKKDEGQGERLPWSGPGARGNFSSRATPLLDFELIV